LQRLDAQKAYQEKYLAAVRRGEFSNAWVDELLRQQECLIYEGEIEMNEEVRGPSNGGLRIKGNGPPKTR
jgi:hypothetical protein